MTTQKNGTVFGGALLVAGTCIGGGMLALPVLTSQGGLLPAMMIYLACWALMASTGLLFLEVSLWLGGEANIVSMAKRTLGRPGQFAAWGLYIFLFYTLTLAYISGSGNLFTDLLGEHVHDAVGTAVFLAIFAPIVYIGPRAVDRVNSIFMLGLGLSYAAFMVLGLPHVDFDLMSHRNWSLSLIALPVAFTSFAYQGIVPTLVYYMGHDAKKTRRAILLGSALPFLCYILWEVLINGTIPTYGPGGLVEALQNNDNAVKPLKNFLKNPWIVYVGIYFAFFALITSFLGVTLGLRDFLADGLDVKKDRNGRILLCCLVFLPPAVLALAYPHIFLESLGYAGGFGCALLLGLLPIMMVWKLRYHMGHDSSQQLPGGKIVLAIMVAAILFEVGCEIAHLTGIL